VICPVDVPAISRIFTRAFANGPKDLGEALLRNALPDHVCQLRSRTRCTVNCRRARSPAGQEKAV
jgi:hypothetical protein